MDPNDQTDEIAEIERRLNQFKRQRPMYVVISVIVITLILITGLTGYLIVRTKKTQTQPTVAVPTLPQPTSTRSPTLSAVLTPTPDLLASPTAMVTLGTVQGKLCYPSSFLPEGTIEARNTTSGDTFTQEYPGSEAGGKETYTFELKPGTYYLRYNTKLDSSQPDFAGYHSRTCPTGKETTCNAESPRVLIPANVKIGETISGYDLCDFYYSDDSEPSF